MQHRKTTQSSSTTSGNAAKTKTADFMLLPHTYEVWIGKGSRLVGVWVGLASGLGWGLGWGEVWVEVGIRLEIDGVVVGMGFGMGWRLGWGEGLVGVRLS